MKKTLSLIMGFVFLLCLTACSGNFAQVDLNEAIPIPENGIIEKSTLEQIKKDNAIATFTGKSGDIEYEWTVFGSDITNARNVNFAVDISGVKDGIQVSFHETEDFGFSALLSIHLNEKWSAQSATAYQNKTAVYSVSLTGSKTSILNISVNKIVPECIVRPDEKKAESNTPNSSEAASSTDSDKTEEHHENKTDDYLSGAAGADNRVYSDGTSVNQDQYQTDPVPQGKPMPVEPENQEINSAKTYTCTFSIECSTILNNLSDLDPDKRELVPSNGMILPPTTVTFYEGESVYDVLQRVCRENNIHMEYSWTPVYNSVYIEGIHNLYEFDCGSLSGWMYRVNGWYPNYGCSRYQLAAGETVEWKYTCDLGKDIGCDWMA